jgi:hypothetical protein
MSAERRNFFVLLRRRPGSCSMLVPGAGGKGGAGPDRSWERGARRRLAAPSPVALLPLTHWSVSTEGSSEGQSAPGYKIYPNISELVDVLKNCIFSKFPAAQILRLRGFMIRYPFYLRRVTITISYRQAPVSDLIGKQ